MGPDVQIKVAGGHTYIDITFSPYLDQLIKCANNDT